jgi:hypothetical protein
MQIFKIKKLLISTLVFLMLPGVVNAATLEFSPTSGSHSTNTTFDVEIKVNTGTEETTSTDAVIVFDNELLSVDSVKYGTFYSTVLHSEQNDKLYISGMVDSPTDVVTGTGVLATITFNTLTAGTATLSFDCTSGKTDDSNVSKNDLDSTDIIVCTSLTDASYTITGDSVATATVAPTSLPETGGTVSSEPTAIPQTGAFDTFQLLPQLMMGFAFIIIGLIPLLI